MDGLIYYMEKNIEISILLDIYGRFFMGEHSIYKDIATRTDGDIYIGVVGPVRSGKSTFIKRFIFKKI